MTTPNIFNPGRFWRDATHRVAYCYDELGGILLGLGFRVKEIYRTYNEPLLRLQVLTFYASARRAVLQTVALRGQNIADFIRPFEITALSGVFPLPDQGFRLMIHPGRLFPPGIGQIQAEDPVHFQCRGQFSVFGNINVPDKRP